jgi:hypothetical protein
MTPRHTLDLAVQDVRYAYRGLRRTPGFTAAAVVTLALGIGANTAFFGLVDAVIFQPTAVARLDEVYAARFRNAARPSQPLLLRQADSEVLERTPPASVAAVTSVSAREGAALIQTAGRAEYVLSERVTPGYAHVFQLRARAGRWFEAGDDPDTAIVIGDRLWREWFGADPQVVGGTLRAGGTVHRVIGVAPPGFRGVQTGLVPTEVWRLMGRPAPPAVPSDVPTAVRMELQRSALTFVRARPGVSASRISGEIAAAIAGQPDPDPTIAELTLVPGEEMLRVDELVALAAGILAFTGLVFLAACANLANMLYARGLERAGEIAIRLSLGAGAHGVVGPFLAEAAIIAAASTPGSARARLTSDEKKAS